MGFFDEDQPIITRVRVAEMKNNDIVKMNPFTRKEAEDFGCLFFDGERKVYDTGDFDRDGRERCKVVGSNNWRRPWLLIKGVDYDD